MSLPKVTKALRFNKPGTPLQILEKDISLPSNELLVKVHSAAINPCDLQIWNSPVVGLVAGDKGIGRDFSGTVAGVGSNVKGWSEGDSIFGMLFHVFGQGTFSEYINVNPTSDPVAKNPGCFTHEQAAAIPLVSLTAYGCLDWLPPQTNSQRKVIVLGASGGTGSFVTHVTAICSGKNAEYVKKLGADEVIDYTTQNVVETLLAQHAENGQSDLLVDCVGGTELLAIYQQILRPTGAYVTIVGDKTDVTTLGGPFTYLNSPSQVIRYIKSWIWGPRYACVALISKGELLEKMVGMGERGVLQIEVQDVVEGAFDEEIQGWKKATDAMKGMRVRGKVVLTIP